MNRASLVVWVVSVVLTALPASASEVEKPSPDACDLEWDRIKGLPPMRKAVFEDYLRGIDEERQGKSQAMARIHGADRLYYLARVPFVIEDEKLPTREQRDAWLHEATMKGHKAARAALMRLRYLGRDTPAGLRVTRRDYLAAAQEAAEAGDGDFATVMMDTARNMNAIFHCAREDRVGPNGCVPQDVVMPSETRYWAERAARSGNPNAKVLLCRMHHFGTYPQWGFEKNDRLAFIWCFAAAQKSCHAGSPAGLLSSMYRQGLGTAIDDAKAKEWETFSRRENLENLNWPRRSR